MEEDDEFSSGVSGDGSGDDGGDDESDESLSASVSAAASAPSSARKAFLSYDRKQSVARQKEVLEQAVGVLGLSCRSVTRSLLRLYRWRVGEAASAWANDSARVAKLLGLSNVHVIGGVLKTKEEGTCSVCFDEGALWGLGACGHAFCRPCWADYVATEVQSQRGQLVACMGDKCDVSVMEDVSVSELLEKQLKTVYLNQLVDSFVAENANCVFCPSKVGCEGIVERLDDATASVVCALCETEFCFLCKERAHDPAPCGGFKSFMERKDVATDASEKLLQAASKACPGCGARIFKHSGCNHVTCGSCQFHFCWQCGGKFGSGPKGGSDGYGTHKCVQMEIKQVESLDAMRDPAEEEFRFNWFVERFEVSNRAVAMGKELLDSVMLSDALAELESTSTAFVSEGLAALIKGRRMLADSYICAYYRLTESQKIFISKDLFDFRMQALSQVVDILSEVLEETLRKCDAYAAAKQLTCDRVRILSVTRAVYDCMQSLLEVASEGQDATELAARGKMMSIAEAKKKIHAKQPPSKRR
jgi:hypothetical protein